MARKNKLPGWSNILQTEIVIKVIVEMGNEIGKLKIKTVIVLL